MATIETQPKEPKATVEPKAPTKDSGFQALDLPKSTETSQALKASEGSRLTEPFRVAGALAGSVFRAVHAMYDNARTDIRVANAAKELAKFEPAQITTGASAQTILDTWSQMAKKNTALKSHMDSLGGAAASIVGASQGRVAELKANVDNALKAVLGDKTLIEFTGAGGAKNLASLNPQQKREFLAAYGELRNNLGQLNSVAQKAEAQALAFYESSVERFQAQDSFKVSSLHNKAAASYRNSLGTLHTAHGDALKSLEGKDPTPDQIREVGNDFAQKLKDLQERATTISTSLEKAAGIEAKVKETLRYLTKGIGSEKAVGASDKSVVFVGEEAADKIAGWVTAQTKEATAELATAKKSMDPSEISAATEKLATASEAVHKQLDDIAKLLSKINGGKDAEGSAAQSQEERILAKATKAGVTEHNSFSSPLSDYVGLLRKEMESRITTMFTADAAGNYDVATGKKGLAIIDKYDDMLERAIEEAKHGGLKANEVKYAVEKIHGMLREELKPPPATPVRTRIDDIVEATKTAKEKELAPPKASLWGKLMNWYANN
jgi:hypothetical protein